VNLKRNLKDVERKEEDTEAIPGQIFSSGFWL
jgi:hypothetical protein